MRMVYVLLAVFVLGAAVGAFAQPAPRSESSGSKTAPDASKPTSTAYPQSPEQVMASLNRALTWYRQSRIAMRSVDTAGVFGRSDEQTAVRLLGRAFDAARAAQPESMETDPYVVIRPEGNWQEPGILERSAARGVSRPSAEGVAA